MTISGNKIRRTKTPYCFVGLLDKKNFIMFSRRTMASTGKFADNVNTGYNWRMYLHTMGDGKFNEYKSIRSFSSKENVALNTIVE